MKKHLRLGGKMRRKSVPLFAIAILVTLISITISGCGKFGSRFANSIPTISITSYEGGEPGTSTDSLDVTLFQQKVFWHAVDNDGVVKGFAYRVLDNNNNPISTPGNKYIDAAGDVTPQNVLDAFGTGWVLHYKQGADQTIPLDNVHAKRTIWTEQKYAVINFPAHDVNGDPDTTICRFEVICMDNRGGICAQKAIKVFRSYSLRPTCFVTTTKGNPNGGQVGTGIRLSFSLNDDDPFLQATAQNYIFRIEKRLTSNDDIAPGTTPTEWFSTMNAPKLNQYLLTKNTTPGLSSDYGTTATYTRVVAKVVDLAGIVSDTTSVRFRVKEGFHPSTILYKQRMYGLGDNHYIDYIDESTPDVLPYTISQGEMHYATPFFRAKDSLYTCVNSSNLKVWLRWGWHGEYGIVTSSGVPNYTDNPFDKKIDVLLDEDTNKNYYSEITHFHIRLDGRPYRYPPMQDSIFVDPPTPEFPEGKRWLRIPINTSLGQTIVDTNISSGLHTFEVRAEDLQGVYDPTPAVFNYRIPEPVSASQKSGILIIDDELNNSFAPNDSVDARYLNMTSGYSGNGGVTVIKRDNLQFTKDIRNRFLAYSDLQQYKLVIYHDDNPTATSNFQTDYDAYALYLSKGGNMVISGGGTIASMVSGCVMAHYKLFEKFFGLTYSGSVAASITNNMLAKNYFVKATSTNGYNTMMLAFDLDAANANPAPVLDNGNVILADPNETPMFNIMNTRKGLGPVSYFTSLTPLGTAIYKYGCKSVFGTPDQSPYYWPSQASYNQYNNLVVGVKKTTSNNKCYMTGFPLSYMKKADAKQFMTTVINEVMAQ